MIEMYVRLIKNVEGWSINRVPEKYKAAVEVSLQETNN